MDWTVSFVRLGSIVALIVYFPQYAIKGAAYVQLLTATVAVSLYWIFFYFEFKKKRNINNYDLREGDIPLAELPLSSLSDLFPFSKYNSSKHQVQNFNKQN